LLAVLFSALDLLEAAAVLAVASAPLPFDDVEDSAVLEVSDLGESEPEDSVLAELPLLVSALAASALAAASALGLA
jgi:hypothetical protein